MSSARTAGASLWFGRNEEGGLRCPPYHGWKYDVTGQAVEVPSEPEGGSTFCARVKLASYPLIKIGDVLWTYMGDSANQPPLPEFEFALVPADQTFTSKRWQECNWLQAFEGGIDSSHVSFLHSGGLKSDPLFKGSKGNEYNMADLKPFFEIADSEGGLFVGARRNADADNYYWRITPWVMPCFTMVPPRGGDHPVHGHFWIPIDDENCWAYSFDYHPVRPLTSQEVQAMKDGHGGTQCEHPWDVPPAGEQGQRLSYGSCGAGARRHILGRAGGHRNPGLVAAGEYGGADRRSDQGAVGVRRQRHHQGAAEVEAGC